MKKAIFYIALLLLAIFYFIAFFEINICNYHQTWHDDYDTYITTSSTSEISLVLHKVQIPKIHQVFSSPYASGSLKLLFNDQPLIVIFHQFYSPPVQIFILNHALLI